MASRNLTSYLHRHGVPFTTQHHDPAYTAQEIAALAHVSGRRLAKTVMLKIDGRLTMLVEAASQRINLERLRQMLNARQIELAHEYEFADKFADCEVGAMAPLSDAYDLDIDVIVDQLWDQEDTIAFNAGNHSELIKMRYGDFVHLTHPREMRLH